MKHLFLFLFLLFFSFEFKAQENGDKAFGKITGRIIDSVSGKPIEYASISLVTQENGKVVNGGTTDDKGVFKLTNVDDGNYKMLIYFIGYKTGFHNNIILNKANSSIALGDIKLAYKQATTLKEITVTSEKSIIENKIDKMVYNAENDVTSQSGVAADVLKKVPGVSIDVDGNIELQGNASIRFLINGKPSTIFGNNITDVLQSIPASQIQSIEIITSPGAKYDAEGTGGIINIILKKSTAEGINGNVSLSGGTRLENGSLNLNAHHGHFSANAYCSGNAQLPSTVLNTMNRSSVDPVLHQTTQLDQSGTSEFSRNGFQSGLGFDWEMNPKNDISGSVGFNYFANSNKGTTNRNSALKDSIGNIFNEKDQMATASNSYSQSLDFSLDYKKTFKKEGQELDISYISSFGNNYSYYKQSQRYLSPDSVYSSSYGKNPGTERETNIALDYTHPIGENTVFETGAKTILNRIGSTSDVYLLNESPDQYTYSSTQSMSLNYKSNVYAAYLSGMFKLFGWLNVKAGLRYEYTEPHAYFSNSGNVSIKAYDTYVPSIVISHKFKKEQMLKLSYTHRIERPEYRDLNPFINASDPKNLTTGNTSLRPEIGDKIELNYSKTFKKGTTIMATLFYRGNKDDIQSYTTYYSSYTVADSIYKNVAVTTRANVGREDNYGLSLFASLPITSKINLRTNINCFQRYIINGALAGKNVQGFNYRINMNATYQISETFVVELFGNFNSPKINTQGTMPAFFTYNFALRKQLFNKKASIAITATNPFNKYVDQKTQLTGDNFTLNNNRQLPYRSFGINFTYKFGKLAFKKEREAEDINLTNPPMGN